MKLRLPEFKLKKTSDETPGPAAPPQAGAEAQSASLADSRRRLLVAGILLPSLLAFFVFQLMSFHVAHVISHESEMTASQVVARVSGMMQQYAAGLQQLATDPEIAQLLLSGDAARVSAREASLRYVYPQVVNVRLMPPGLNQVDMNESPPLSYAALAQMQEAETGKGDAPAEVHLFNTPQQHINIVRRVEGPAGGRVVGHIMLSLPNSVLQDILAGVHDMKGYIELQQGGEKGAPAAVASHGDAADRSGDPDRVMAVPGTRWQVAYWPASGTLLYLGKVGTWVLVALAACVGLLAFYTIAQFSRIGRALRQDEASIVNLLKDFSDRRLRRSYPATLLELKDTLEFMLQYATTALHRDSPRAAGGREHGREDDQTVAVAVQAETGAAENVREQVDIGNSVARDEIQVPEEGALDIYDEEMTVDASIFRAYDIRGVVDRTLTRNTVFLIGRAIGSEALQRGRDTVVVARDGRLSGPSLAAALTEGITATGCNVIDIGSVPTPVLYFATYHLNTQTGVVVTGSHNPPDYNGLKIVIDGETLSGESIQELRERIESGNLISGQGSVRTMNIEQDYIDRILGDVSIARPVKVVVDCGNGVAGIIAPRLLRALGCEVIELFCDVDGNFPNHHPDPSKTENLVDLIGAVHSTQADLGLAFDGDGDRLGVVTSSGDVVWPDRLLMLYAKDILARNPGGQIIYDVKCTRFLDGIIRENGGQPLMWKTGHSFIKAKIKESGALLAGEMSGHIFIKERWYGFDDGIYSAARLLEILSGDQRPPVELFDELPDSVNTPELNVAMKEGEPQVFIGRLLEHAHFDNATVSTIDGLRVDFADGWGLVRASNTTPVLVLRFEADNEQALERIKDEFRRLMLQVDAGLQLPF